MLGKFFILFAIGLTVSVGQICAAAECENNETGSFYTNEHGNVETGSCESKENRKLVPSGRMEHTFCMIKPDGIQRNLIGEIIKRFEAKGLKLIALNFHWPKEEVLRKHYIKLEDTPFFEDMIKYVNGGPVVTMVWEGYNVINISRQLLSGPDRFNPVPGSIRGDYSSNDFIHRFTVVHCSDSVEEVQHELPLWFTDDDLVSWNFTNEIWIYQK